MRNLILVFFLGLGAALPSLSIAKDGDTVKGIKINCKSEWADDFAMQKYCIDRQIKAFNSIVNLQKGLNGNTEKEGKKIINRCFSEWRGSKIDFDYAMVAYCSKRQFKALKQLNNY